MYGAHETSAASEKSVAAHAEVRAHKEPFAIPAIFFSKRGSPVISAFRIFQFSIIHRTCPRQEDAVAIRTSEFGSCYGFSICFAVAVTNVF